MRLRPEGISLHYTDTGPENSAPVLLVHGGGSSSATWARLTAELTVHGYRVIAPDLRGHGASPRGADYRLLSYHAARFADRLRSATFPDLRITRVFPCVARGLKPRVGFRFTRRCWR